MIVGDDELHRCIFIVAFMWIRTNVPYPLKYIPSGDMSRIGCIICKSGNIEYQLVGGRYAYGLM